MHDVEIRPITFPLCKSRWPRLFSRPCQPVSPLTLFQGPLIGGNILAGMGRRDRCSLGRRHMFIAELAWLCFLVAAMTAQESFPEEERGLRPVCDEAWPAELQPASGAVLELCSWRHTKDTQLMFSGQAGAESQNDEPPANHRGGNSLL